MELVRQKNVATYIVFPIVDADGDIVTGAAGLDEEIDAWDDATAPDGFVDCSNTATEIAATGVYYLLMAQAEMNNDYIYVQVKTSTSGAKTQHILIRTMVGDPLLVGTTESGRAIDVGTHGCVGIDFNNFATPSNTSAITNLTVPVVGTVTGAVNCNTVTSNLIIAGSGVIASTVTSNLIVAGSGVIASTLTSQYVSPTATGVIVATSTAAYVSGAGVVVTTNSDKTGYGLTATQAVICNTITSDLGVICNTLTSQYVSSTGTGMIVATSTAAYISGAGVVVTTNNDKTGYGLTSTASIGTITSGYFNPTSGGVSVGTITASVVAECNTITSDLIVAGAGVICSTITASGAVSCNTITSNLGVICNTITSNLLVASSGLVCSTLTSRYVNSTSGGVSVGTITASIVAECNTVTSDLIVAGSGVICSTITASGGVTCNTITSSLLVAGSGLVCSTLTSQYVSATHTGVIVATSTAAYVSGAGVVVTTNSDKTGYGLTATQAVICNTITSDLGVICNTVTSDKGVICYTTTADSIDDKVLAAVVEGTITIQQALALMLAVQTGKSSGGGTASLTFRDTADLKDRLIVTVDADGNRTAVGTRDGS